jgi:hypothetical protein
MNKMFKDNGFLSEEGDKVLHSFHYGLVEAMATTEVRNMSVQELQVLQANLASLVGNTISKAIQAKNQSEK